MGNRLQASLADANRMSVTWELIPGRGAREKLQENVLLMAEQAAKGGRIDAVTITDNPGGNPAILADYLGQEILALGVEPLVHFTCKDRNRNQIESQLYALDRGQVRNLLVMTGDYPVTGFQGRPLPVFDLDPVHVLRLIGEMNQGMACPGPKGVSMNQPANFFAGAAVSPFKSTEAEQRVQYFKLKKKIAAGAEFVVTQLGYDARKFHELMLFMKLNGLHVPVVGNIYVLPYGAGKLMNQNKIPGCVVTDKLLAELDRERQASDKGVEARLLRAAKMYAFMKGMGFSGVHIGGHGVKYDHVLFIMEKGEELHRNWQDLTLEFDYPQPGGFYLYDQDKSTGLNREMPVRLENRPSNAPVGFVYRLSRIFHHLMFEPDRRLFGFMSSVAGAVAGTMAESTFHKLEHLAKVLLYDCRDCGDCALTDLAYNCPMSQCPKNQRNGACGGSYEGWCEVHPGKRQCVYVKAYSRLKRFGEGGTLDTYTVSPCNWDLYQSSSWINFYMGRDHSAERFGIRKSEEHRDIVG
ncbi:MAG: methylenetetrahydrofolate reductase C-terminal domain-containing protein [Deltaproteobacteria bacterium]|nr:methylenetetrahydrofolate reductase C-terminal domain-containing protein [Deltaproteobacteria bacterium]